MAIPVIVMGLGPIGRSIVAALPQARGLNLIGVVDPAYATSKLAELVPNAPELVVQKSIASLATRKLGAVVLHATGSYLPQVEDQLIDCVKAGCDVVSTCEELAYPYLRYERAAANLDRLAMDLGQRVLGTGVNPGFVFERVSSLLSHVVGEVRFVTGTRVVDSRLRRTQLQIKTGAGLPVAEFERKKREGHFGHVGLRESAALLALGCGLGRLDRVEEELTAVVAGEHVAANDLAPAGSVAGIRQVAQGYIGSRHVTTLDLTIAAGATPARDEIQIDAVTPISLRIDGGIPGDSATVWTTLNAATQIKKLSIGLRTVVDLPVGRH